MSVYKGRSEKKIPPQEPRQFLPPPWWVLRLICLKYITGVRNAKWIELNWICHETYGSICKRWMQFGWAFTALSWHFTPFGCEGICCDLLAVRGGRRDKKHVLRCYFGHICYASLKSNKSHTSLYGHRDFCMDPRGLAKDNHGVLVHPNAEQDDFRWNINWKQTVTSSKYLT